MSLIRQIKSILTKNDPALPAVVKTQRTGERRRQKRYSHTGRRILIIDDSPTIVAALGKILDSAGCLVSEAADAESGIVAARNEQPDLIFLDIVLPGINGFAALRQMRKEEATSRIPVIMISGNEQATEQFYAKRIGADDFMKKPFARHEIFSRIEALVNAGKLPQIELATAQKGATALPVTPQQTARPEASIAPQPAAAPAPPEAAPPPPRQERRTPHLSNEAVASMSQMEARQQLASMGLQYFSQEQFNSAVKRADKLAVDLFIIGGGIQVK